MGTLPVGKNILDRAIEVIISFVNGKERKIAANRHFLPRESGGYGITDMNILNMCIKASWIKRWCSSEKNDDYSEMRCIKGKKGIRIISTGKKLTGKDTSVVARL